MKNEYVKDAVKNSYFVLFLSIFGIAVVYVLPIFLSRYLSIEDFGLFYAVSAFVGLFTIVRYLGLNQALTKFIPEFIIKKQVAQIKSSVLTTIIVQLVTIATFTGIILLFQNDIAAIFKSGKAGAVLTLMVLSFIPSIFFTVFQSVFQGYQKLKTYALVEPVRISLTFGLSVFFVVFAQLGVAGVAWAYLCAATFTSIIFSFGFFRLDIISAKAGLSQDLTKKLFRFGIPVFMSSIALIIISFTDTIVITFFRTLDEVALYQVALPTTQLLLVFSSAIAAVVFPLVSHLYASRKLAEIERGLRVISVTLLFLLLPFVILLYSFPEIVIQVLFSSNFLPAVNTIKILSIGMIFYSLFVLFPTTLDGIGKPFINTKIMFAMAGLNIAMNLLLVPFLGIMGAAVAFTATFLIGMLAGWGYIRKYLKVSFAYSRIAKIFTAAVLSGAVAHLMKIWISLPQYEEFFAVLAVSWAMFIGVIIFSRCITKEDIDFIESKNFHLPGSVKRITRTMFRRRK